MLARDISLSTPEENILFDEVLLKLAEEGGAGECLRFWESISYFIVLGRMSKVEEDVNVHQAQKDGVAILRRSSGGGTVLQGPGCLNYSLILSKEQKEISDLKKSYKFILKKVVDALDHLGINADYFPISDIALVNDERKISGNAQKRGRNYILHHGTLLIDFDLNLIANYLKLPKEIPQYRKERSHIDFLSNLDVSQAQLKQSLMDVFDAEANKDQPSNKEKNLIQELLNTKEVFV